MQLTELIAHSKAVCATLLLGIFSHNYWLFFKMKLSGWSIYLFKVCCILMFISLNSQLAGKHIIYSLLLRQFIRLYFTPNLQS